MPLPIRPLPIVESWDCRGCGLCCYGTIFALSDADLARLKEQDWSRRPGFEGKRVVTRHGLLRKHYRLARRSDGACIFLTAENRCRIHAELGEPAKPHTCRMFPFQLTPMSDFAWVSLRRFCPSAAAGEGRPMSAHMAAVRQMAEEGQLAQAPGTPPAVIRGQRRDWSSALRAGEAMAGLLRDERYPPVRRMIHTLTFCDLLSQCRLGQLDRGEVVALLQMLTQSALDDKATAALFRDRRPPGRAAGLLFRQTLLEYVRLHPAYIIEGSLVERWRLVRAAMAFARGKGPLPFIHDAFPRKTFEAIEAPLGNLPAEVIGPLTAYLETTAVSMNFAMLGHRGWSLVEGVRSMALSFAVAMWMLRLMCGERAPAAADMIGVVGALERGNSYAPLCGERHRRRVASLYRLRALPGLLAWYAR